MSLTEAFGLEKKNNFDLYDLRIGEPKISQFPSDIFEKFSELKNINQYYPSHGDLELKEMILNRYYKDLNAENIAITHGSLGALDFIMRANLDSSSEILIPDPGFPPYEKMAQFSRAKIKKYQIDLCSQSQTSIDWEHVKSLVNQDTLFILINSPHNPTGKIFTQKDKRELENLLVQYPKIQFILDEVYRELVYNNCNHVELYDWIDRGFVIGSFSKTFPLQGARIGWVLTDRNKLLGLSPFFNNATGAMSSFGQELAKKMIVQKYNYKKNYESAYIAAKNILDKYGVDYIKPDGAFFFFIKYQKNHTDIVRELSELGVGVVAGENFGDRGKPFIRVSFAQEQCILNQAFSIIGKHWKDLHKRTTK